MEVGDATESTDPALFEKMPVFWNPGGRPPLRSIYHDLIKLRKGNPALCNGSLEWVSNTATNQVVSFLRKDDKDEFLVLINFASGEVSGSVSLEDADGFEPVSIANLPPRLIPACPNLNLRVADGSFSIGDSEMSGGKTQ